MYNSPLLPFPPRSSLHKNFPAEFSLLGGCAIRSSFAVSEARPSVPSCEAAPLASSIEAVLVSSETSSTGSGFVRFSAVGAGWPERAALLALASETIWFHFAG